MEQSSRCGWEGTTNLRRPSAQVSRRDRAKERKTGHGDAVPSFTSSRILLLLMPKPTPGRGSGSRVSRVPRLVSPSGTRPFGHRHDLLCHPERSRLSNDSMCGSDEVRCTPMVALLPLMDTTSFRLSGGPERACTANFRVRGVIVSLAGMLQRFSSVGAPTGRTAPRPTTHQPTSRP